MKSNEYQLNTFLEYVRTKQFLRHMLKDVNPSEHVYISMTEIRERFLVNPKEDIEHLIQLGELDVLKQATDKGHTVYLFSVQKPGYYNLSLIQPKGKPLDKITSKMMDILTCVTLKPDAPSTEFFNCFLMHKNEFRRQFFTIDDFSGRVHTPVTNFKSEYRKNLLIDGIETTSLDVVTMQPVLLGAILKKQLKDNQFSNWIDEGKDIYLMLQETAKLKSRDDAKKKFFEILFSKPNDSLTRLFGNTDWISWINEFKKQPIEMNPKTLEKTHNNLAWLLQTNEVLLMRKVWERLLDHDIKFLSVHDEIIVKLTEVNKARDIFETVLSENLTFFRISTSKNTPPDEVKQPEDKNKPRFSLDAIPPLKLFYPYELSEKFNLSDATINEHFEECFGGALWKRNRESNLITT
jgi:hypothetical protein